MSFKSNPLRLDPTRTVTLRRAFASKLKQKFARLRYEIVKLVVEEDAFGLRPAAKNPLVGNTRWRFQSDPEKVKAFQEWLRAQIAARLRSQSEQELWKRYVEAGFRKGAARAFDDAKRVERLKAAREEKLDFYAGSKEQFLRDSFHRPVAIEKVQLLAGRSFDDLENVTTDMSTRLTRSLMDGLVRGQSPRDIAHVLAEDVNISSSRASTIARTEIVRAHAEGQLTALENLGVEEVGVAVEWSTAGDDAVCRLCQPLEGVVLRIDEARGMLPRHPNCRCAWIPVGVGEDRTEQKRSKPSIEEAFEESELDEEVSESRPSPLLNLFSRQLAWRRSK